MIVSLSPAFKPEIGLAATVAPLPDPAEPIHKIPSVLIVEENLPAFNTTTHDMV